MNNSSVQSFDEEQSAQNQTSYQEITVGVTAAVVQTGTNHAGTTGVTLV